MQMVTLDRVLHELLEEVEYKNTTILSVDKFDLRKVLHGAVGNSMGSLLGSISNCKKSRTLFFGSPSVHLERGYWSGITLITRFDTRTHKQNKISAYTAGAY